MSDDHQRRRHERMFAIQGVVYYVAVTNDGDVIGFCSGGPSRRSTYVAQSEIYAIYLMPGFERRGIGRRLFESVVADIAASGRKGLFLTALSVNPPEAAQRLFAMSQPIRRTLVETYLRNRAIAMLAGTGALRFHPRCYYRDEHSPTETWPAMIAAVTDLDGRITGAHRTWLDPNGFDAVRLGKAPIDTQRKAMGGLLGHAVRFGVADEVMAVGEGLS